MLPTFQEPEIRRLLPAVVDRRRVPIATVRHRRAALHVIEPNTLLVTQRNIPHVPHTLCPFVARRMLFVTIGICLHLLTLRWQFSAEPKLDLTWYDYDGMFLLSCSTALGFPISFSSGDLSDADNVFELGIYTFNPNNGFPYQVGG